MDLPEELRRLEDRLGVIEAANVEMERRAAPSTRGGEGGASGEDGGPAEEEADDGQEDKRATAEGAESRDRGPKDQVNVTDPDSLIMKSSEGFVQACQRLGSSGSRKPYERFAGRIQRRQR